jgi:pyruvate-formate lyase-activating enzyme
MDLNGNLNNKMELINLFNTDVKLKTHYCSFFGQKNEQVEDPYINLYLRTKYCNAKCPFCTYHSDASKWNHKKYIEVLKEISSKIKIRKIAFSGGEPTLFWENFKNMVYTAKEYSPMSEFSINTDGFKIDRFFSDPIYKIFDFIHLSRHHYDDKINDTIFKTKTPTSDEILEISKLQTHEHQFQFRCNLIKGFIDNKEEVFKYLDWSNSVGVNDIGLVSLMPINEYSKENFIYFHIKELIGDNFLLTKKQERHGGGCECFNYIYMPNEESFRRPIRVYHKNTYAPTDIQETLVFDGENVRLGFEGPIIF